MLSVSALELVGILSLLLGLNPFTLSVMSALISGGFGKRNRQSRMRQLSLTFLLTFGTFLVLSGLLVTTFLRSISEPTQTWIIFAISTFVVTFGLLELANLYVNQQSISLPRTLERKMHVRTTKKITFRSTFELGVWTGVATILILGLPLIALWTIIATSTISVYTTILVGVALFLLPVFVIAGFAVHGTSLAAIIAWKEETNPLMRATIGVTSIIIGWLLLMWLGGSMEFLS